ncbi:hypothetical protein HU200_050699 [Digitaria exilis]|uniref:Uncharacterized protein n=1 Tax=Digitaria exilis TaxID=1010633 RepID=A0A835AT59_9POAL|nr:hypothetical protein HU200_050699 [Digitaria exilis]
MDSELPLVEESVSTRASRLSRSAPSRLWFRKKLDVICSALTSVQEFIQFGQRLTMEPLPSHLQIGKNVEMVEDNGCTFVEGKVIDVSHGDGTILVKPNCDNSDFISSPKDKVRPGRPSSGQAEHDGKGPHPSFVICDVVD